MTMSRRTMSGRTSSALASASSPPLAVTTRKPSSDSAMETSLVIRGSSSATRTRGWVLMPLLSQGVVVCAAAATRVRCRGTARSPRRPDGSRAAARGSRLASLGCDGRQLDVDVDVVAADRCVPPNVPWPGPKAKYQMPTSSSAMTMTPRMAPHPASAAVDDDACRDRRGSCVGHPCRNRRAGGRVGRWRPTLPTRMPVMPGVTLQNRYRGITIPRSRAGSPNRSERNSGTFDARRGP